MLLKHKEHKASSLLFCASSHCFRYIKVHIFTLNSKSRSSCITLAIIRRKIFKSIKVVMCIFWLALAASEIFTYNNCDLQRVRQLHGIQFFQLRYSMAIVKIYKCLPQIFPLALSVSEKITSFRKHCSCSDRTSMTPLRTSCVFNQITDLSGLLILPVIWIFQIMLLKSNVLKRNNCIMPLTTWV